MLELINNEKYNINDYFIIMVFNNPRSKQWDMIRNIIINNFEYQEENKTLFLFCKNELKQLEKVLFIMEKTGCWVGTLIFIEKQLVKYGQAIWLYCYIDKLKQYDKHNCVKKYEIYKYGLMPNKIKLPCGNFHIFEKEDMFTKQSGQKLQTFLNNEAEVEGFIHCPFYNKNYVFNKNYNKYNKNNDKQSNMQTLLQLDNSLLNINDKPNIISVILKGLFKIKNINFNNEENFNKLELECLEDNELISKNSKLTVYLYEDLLAMNMQNISFKLTDKNIIYNFKINAELINDKITNAYVVDILGIN